MTGEFKRFLYGVIEQSEDIVDTAQTSADAAQASANTAQTAATNAQTSADAAQTSATNAAATSTTAESNSPVTWFTDTAGNWPAGDPTKDITIRFKDKDDTQVAERVLRGTLTSSTGVIAVTSVSNSGLTTAFSLSGNNSGAVKATVSVTLADSSVYRTVVNWGTIDTSAAGDLSFSF